MFALMAIKELYRNFLLKLQDIYNLSEATTITDWVFEKITALKKADIIKAPAQLLNPSAIKSLNNALSQLLKHKPVQYVLGEAWFYHLKLKVNEQVLIPRPETEELVELMISNCRSKITDPAILDIGTGSGCIPIAIKKNLPAAKLTAVDVSEKALLVAKENAAQYNTPVNFIAMNFLDEAQWPGLPVFDIIISNPPYIPLNEKEKLAKNVLAYEPHTALFVPDKDPLIFYEKIAAFSKVHLQAKGMIYLETHEDLAKEVATLFNKDHSNTEIKKDIFGKDRMVIVTT